MAIIKINDQKKEIPSGVVKASLLYEGITADSLYMKIFEDYVPIDKNDHVLIIDEVNIITEVLSDVSNNPLLGKSLSVSVNDDECTISQAKIEREHIANFDKKLDECEVYVDLGFIETPDFHVTEGTKLLITEAVKFITIPKSSDGIVDIEECVNLGRRIPKRQKKYRIKIDGEKHIVSSSGLTGKEILELSGLEWQRFDLQQKFQDGQRKQIKYNEYVDFPSCSVQRFETIPKEAQQG